MVEPLDTGDAEAAGHGYQPSAVPAEAALARIVQVTAFTFQVPVVMIVLEEGGVRRLAASAGLTEPAPIGSSRLLSAGLTAAGIIVVPDALGDRAWADDAWVRDPPRVRFFAAAPLRIEATGVSGTVAVLDRVPRASFDQEHRTMLAHAAEAVVDHLELRRVAARLKSEQQVLAEQRAFAQLLLDGSNEGIFATDANLRCTLWNPALASMSQIPAERVVGRILADVDSPLKSEKCRTSLRGALSGHAVAIRDEEYVRPDGSVGYFAAHLSPLRDKNRAIVGVIAFVRDTSEHWRLEEQLRHAQKMEAVGRLTGSIAHDFNNLLTVLIGNLDLAIPRVGHEPKALEMLLNASAAAQRGEALTRQLLAFARRQELKPQPIDLNATVTRMVRMLERTLPAGVTISTDLAPDVRPVMADPHQLEVSLLNVVLNARDAMPSGGRISLQTTAEVLGRENLPAGTTAHPGEFARLVVTDTGIGMSQEVLSRIFEPFFTTKGPQRGTGLGLAQVYGFVTQSHGYVRVDSVVGDGTSLELFLPTTDAAPRLAEPDAYEAEILRRRGGTVLVVEDDAEVRALASNVLGQHGYRTLSVPDGEAALTLIRGHPEIDLVFSDVVLPGDKSGLDLATKVNMARPSLPILLATGYTDLMREIQRAGIPLLMKPYRAGELVKRVDELLGNGGGAAPIAPPFTAA